MKKSIEELYQKLAQGNVFEITNTTIMDPEVAQYIMDSYVHETRKAAYEFHYENTLVLIQKYGELISVYDESNDRLMYQNDVVLSRIEDLIEDMMGRLDPDLEDWVVIAEDIVLEEV